MKDFMMQVLLQILIMAFFTFITILILYVIWDEIYNLSIGKRLKSPISSIETNAKVKELTLYEIRSGGGNQIRTVSYRAYLTYTYKIDNKLFEETCHLKGLTEKDPKETVKEMLSLFPDQQITIRTDKTTELKDSFLSKTLNINVPENLDQKILIGIAEKFSDLSKPKCKNTSFYLKILKSNYKISLPSKLLNMMGISIGAGIIMGLFLGGIPIYLGFRQYLPKYSYLYACLIMAGLIFLEWILTYTPLINYFTPKHDSMKKDTEFMVWCDEKNKEQTQKEHNNGE